MAVQAHGNTPVRRNLRLRCIDFDVRWLDAWSKPFVGDLSEIALRARGVASGLRTLRPTTSRKRCSNADTKYRWKRYWLTRGRLLLRVLAKVRARKTRQRKNTLFNRIRNVTNKNYPICLPLKTQKRIVTGCICGDLAIEPLCDER